MEEIDILFNQLLNHHICVFLQMLFILIHGTNKYIKEQRVTSQKQQGYRENPTLKRPKRQAYAPMHQDQEKRTRHDIRH
jgi:hypothetical protein